MSFFSKPVGALCSLLFLLQLVTLVTARGIRLDPKSCAKYKAYIDKALDEVEDMVQYAEKRADPKSQYKRQGTLLQDMLDASNEDDTYVLRKVQATFKEVQGTLRDNKIIIHCDDTHLTKSTKTVFNDNSNGRQARVQVLDSPKRKGGACGGIQRAFAYQFYDAKTRKVAGEAIVLCSDSSTGALKAADLTKTVGDWRDRNLEGVGQGIDMLGRHLSYMILHELMHATDVKSFPVNPGGGAEKYGYEEITGHKVGTTGHGGPGSLVRLANADSYALLACGWYLNVYKIENGKFVIIKPKADRPPTTLRRRWTPPLLEAREPKSKPKKTKNDDPPPATSKAAAPPASSQAPPPPPSTQAPPPPSSQAPPVSSQVPPASSQVPPPSSQALPPSSKATSASHGTTSGPVTTPSGSRTSSVSTQSSSTSSWLPPIVTAVGDVASKFPVLLPLGVIAMLPDFGSGNDTTNSTAPINGTATGISIPTFTGSAGWNDTAVSTALGEDGMGISAEATSRATGQLPGATGWNSTLITATKPAGTGYPTIPTGFVTSVIA